MVKEKIKESACESKSEVFGKKLILLNDNINTFDHVIDSLIEVCNHTEEQAEQCAVIAHFKGKCPVSSGKEEKLLKYKRMLSEKKIRSVVS